PESRTPTNGTPSPESRTPTNGTPIAQSPLPITELLLPTSVGELRTALPSVYQVSANGTRNEIEATFQLTDKNIFGITLPNGYNPDHSLRIDPLIYSTFLGGNSYDSGAGIILESDGSTTIAGSTESTNFPTTPGAYNRNYLGNDDCFITRFSTTGTLVFSTYVGGFGNDYCYGLCHDQTNGLVITVQSQYGAQYPNTRSWGVAGSTGNFDCYITRLNNSGSQLTFSDRFGSSLLDCPTAITCDSDGITVCGYTEGTNFPTTTNALFTSSRGGMSDWFVTQVSLDGTQLQYSTYLGSSGSSTNVLFEESANSINSDHQGGVFITGTVNGPDFPVTLGAYDTTFNGFGDSTDAAIVHLSIRNSQIIASTYLGGIGRDMNADLAVIDTNFVYVTGATSSFDFPVVGPCYDSSHSDNRFNQYLVRISYDLSHIERSTFWGGIAFPGNSKLLIISDTSIIVCGVTDAQNLPTTSNAESRTYLGGIFDIYLVKFNRELTDLLYGSYFGGNDADGVSAKVCDEQGRLYLTGGTGSNNFPTTANAFDPTYNDTTQWGDDGFFTIFSIPTTGLIEPTVNAPSTTQLLGNYPNPFNSSTTISYSLPKPGQVDLRLFDITGREVATLVNQRQPTGSYRVTLDGEHLSSGTYFVRMQAGDFVKTQKMVLLR
ncbi:MAG: T9SS type A sorting domain-containing protein, partial [bacterium]|nr:T9SS type A sorting domain-containing protein [bacterium]